MLETLRNALLITLLVILVYVLYRRMLNAMGKNEIKERYIYFTEDSLKDENASRLVSKLNQSKSSNWLFLP
jgi:bacterioferritin (cytochrome b1)